MTQIDRSAAGAVVSPKVYTIEEIAAELTTSLKLIRRYVASGQLAAEQHGAKYSIPETSYKTFCERYTSVDETSGRRKLGAVTVQFLPGLGVDPEEKLIKKAVVHRSAASIATAELQNKDSAPFRKRGKSKGSKNKVKLIRANTDDVNWQDISAFWEAPSHSEMTFVDLFCGAGGLSKGLEMSGLNGICGLDWFDEAGMTYARNFDHPFINGDIKQPENKKKFYETVRTQLNGRKLNLVAGGFPCQGFSMAGNRIVDDPRNSLYKELIEIVDTLKPDFVLCENVKGLRSMLGGAVGVFYCLRNPRPRGAWRDRRESPFCAASRKQRDRRDHCAVRREARDADERGRGVCFRKNPHLKQGKM